MMRPVTTSSALERLREATGRLLEAVTELVMLAHEDRPPGNPAAAVDQFVDHLSELRSSVAAADLGARTLDLSSPRVEEIARVDESLADASLRYWRDLRSDASTDRMRRQARTGGAEWRAWQASLDSALDRCEDPLIETLASVRNLWSEYAAERPAGR